MKRFFFLLLFLALAILHAPAELGHKFPPIKPEELAKMQAAMPQATVKPAKPRKLLVFYLTEGYVHGSIPYCNEVIKEMGEKTGAFTADFSEDMGVFTPDNLKQYDAVLLNNTTGLKFIDPAARQALLDYVKTGKGLAGIHSATDNFPTWLEGQALLGGKFDGHPWGSGDVEAVKVDDPSHPVVAAFGGKGFWINDEIYQMRAPYERSEVRVLLSLDMSKPQNARDPKNIHRLDNDFPICWIKQVEGGGRVFYCSLGHNPSVYWTPQVLQVYLNGIQYALGDLPVDATPSGKLSPPPAAALAPEIPDPINSKPTAPPPTPATPKPTAINGRVPPFVSMILSTELSAATDAATSDPLADGVKAVSAYAYGAERNDIVDFDNYIRSQPPESRGKIETALLPLLSQAGISVGAKDYICRWLGVIGSDASVPVLEKLTRDPKLSHMAVYALLSMGSPAAKSALVSSLGHVPAALRPAIIGAIGRAGITEAVPNLAKIATLDDRAQAAAALDALGAIGTSDSLAALNKATVPSPLEATRQWALIHAASHVLKMNPSDKEGPLAVFAALLKPGSVSSLRVAATKGYIEADPSGAWPVISNLLKDDDVKVRLDVAKLTPQLSADAIAPLAAAQPGLDPDVQIVIVNSFALTQGASAEPILEQALASANADVHLAAIHGYGTANLASSAAALLPFLDKTKDEVDAATASLGQLTDPGFSEVMKIQLAQATGSTKAAWLNLVSDRQDYALKDQVYAATSDPDATVAEAAFDAVETLVKDDDLPRVLTLLPLAKTDAQYKSLDKALSRSAHLYSDKDKAADLITTALTSATPDHRQILIAALTSIDSEKAAAGLENLLQAPSVDGRKEVIRALALAHNNNSVELLFQVASQGKENSEKILALRGYLDGIRAQKLAAAMLLDDYKKAWPLAQRQEEKDAILAAVKNTHGDDARKLLAELSASNTPSPTPAQ